MDIEEKAWIGLAVAAAQLRLPYQDAHRLVLTGSLQGEKRGGRWYVRRADVQDLARKRAKSKSS